MPISSFLSSLPPTTRALLQNLQLSYHNLRDSFRAPKNEGKCHSRQHHYLKWYDDMKLIPTLPYSHQSDNNLVMALYDMRLVQGYGIQFHTITPGTIKRYLMLAAAISEAHKLPDPRLNSRDTTLLYINKVLDELKRWEAVSNRHEPVTVAMLRHMHVLCAIQHADSRDSSLHDWNVHYGFHLGE